ncbi:MAG: lysine--tRNA ligase [bacterium]|nr:lysine--tRNA ligase [bacterium]
MTENATDQHQVRIQKLQALREAGVEPFAYSYSKTHDSAQLVENFDSLAEAQTTVSIAGRLMTIRSMGKSIFANLQDDAGQIQIYVKKDAVAEGEFEVFKKADLGDIFGVEGYLFLTKMGEKSVHVSKVTLLAKSLRPMPEKWHGLQDKETRYRRRYLDMIANPEVREVFKKRSLIVRALRDFLDGEGFVEVETPVLQPIYGGAAARPFITHHNRLDVDLFMRVADELYLKRLIVGGFEKVWEFCKDFRNEGMDRNHNPEFTMIELYWAYADYQDVMKLYQRMITTVATKVLGTTTITFGENQIELGGEWRVLPMLDGISEAVGRDISQMDEPTLRKFCGEIGVKTEGLVGRGKLIDELFSEKLEHKLIQPTFITDYPKELSPLAKPHRSKEGLTERFEVFIGGMEMGNAFSELNDPIDQKERFQKLVELAKAGDEEAPAVLDEDYIFCLEHGMPPTGGLGFGVDRLCMMLLNQHSIRDVILFPQMKPE